MRLGDVQKAARPQEMGDDLGPSVDVGQPANRAPADEHDIEAGRLRDRRRRVVEIGEDEISSVGQTQLTGQSPGSGDRIRGKIQADGIGAALREFQGVGTEMALQVQDTLAGNRTELGLLDRVEEPRSGTVNSGPYRPLQHRDGTAQTPPSPWLLAARPRRAGTSRQPQSQAHHQALPKKS